MKKDQSRRNYNYRGMSIDEIISEPEEYIVPECLEACKKFWSLNIFTASCSNRNEQKDKDGNIKKYIMVSHLSQKNDALFRELAKLNSNNYCILDIQNTVYYAIVISSKDEEKDLDLESQKLLNLASPFEMQDCLEGIIPIEDYYSEKFKDPFTLKKAIPTSDAELIECVKQNLNAFGKLDLLDLERRIVYKSKFFKDAHQKYLDYLKEQTNSDSQGLDFI